MNWYLRSASSAPGESPDPPPRGMHETIPDIRRDVIKARAIVSELEHNFTSTQVMVSNIHRAVVEGLEGGDSKNLLVSDTSTVSTTE